MVPTAVILLALSVPVGAPTPAEAFREAERLAAADKVGEAEALYRVALATDDRFLKRETYDRLMSLYVRSGRPDKAVQLGAVFRDWLKSVGESSFAALDLLTARCQLELGYTDAADKFVTAALEARPPLAPGRRLEALRLRAEIAIQKKDATEKQRWEDLEKASAGLAA